MKNFHYLCNIKITKMEDINRIKVVLAEKKQTNKWLCRMRLTMPYLMTWRLPLFITTKNISENS